MKKNHENLICTNDKGNYLLGARHCATVLGIKNSLCLHIAKSFFGEIELEKEIKMCYVMKKEVQVAKGISGESN